MEYLIDQISKRQELELDVVDLRDYDSDQLDKIIFDLVICALENCNPEAVVNIINHIDEIRIDIDPLPTITKLITNEHFDNGLIKLVTSLFPKEPTGYFLDLINSHDDELALKTAKKLKEIFTDIKEDEWIELSVLTNDIEDMEYENILLRGFLLEQTKNYSKMPDWIIEYEEGEILPHPENIPTPEEAINMILTDMDKLKIRMVELDNNEEEEFDSDEITKENLISQYSISTANEKILMLSNIIKLSEFDDSLIFKECGPVNSFYSNIIDNEHECSKYGGCRMLLCNEYPDDDCYKKMDIMSDNNIIPDWFTGKCLICERKIREKHHALRLPLHRGGWKGCYCSFSCLVKEVNNPTLALTVGRMKSQLYQIGINDR